MANLLLIILLYCMLTTNIPFVRCFSADTVGRLERLLDSEQQWLSALDDYLSAEEYRIQQLRDLWQRLTILNENGLIDKESYLGHPLDVYASVKRMAVEWPHIDQLVLSKTSIQLYDKVLSRDMTVITDQHLNEAADGIGRLQYYYKLQTKVLANGVLDYKSRSLDDSVWRHSDSALEMDAYDCYLMASRTFRAGDYQHSIEWCTEAIKRLDDPKNYNQYIDINDQQISEIVSFVSYVYHKREINSNSLMTPLMRLVTKLIPQKTVDNIAVDYQKTMMTTDKPPINDQTISEQSPTDNEAFEQLCREERYLSQKYSSRLRCYHLNTAVIPSLRLTRVKVEVIHKKPYIWLIHGFLSPTESETVKSIARQELDRQSSTVADKPDAAVHRWTLRSTHIDTDHPVFGQISRRLATITGVGVSSGEPIDVIRYGAGGYYRQHHDSDLHHHHHWTSKNLLTWLTWLSDVELGGDIVFPALNVTVHPAPGSALVWYSLLQNNADDPKTVHGQCPVLLGQKWVATKLVSTRGGQVSSRFQCPKKYSKYYNYINNNNGID